MMKVVFHFGGGEQLITLPTENKKKAKITGMRTFRGANPRSTIDHQVAVNALRESKRHGLIWKNALRMTWKEFS